MNSIKVIEHEKIRISNKYNPDLKQISKIDAKYLHELEVKQDKKIFNWKKDSVSPNQWVGIIRIPNGSIEILPKIADETNEDKLRAFLIHMLKVVHDIPVRKNIESNLDFGENGFLEILISNFLTELEKQVQHGLYKTYEKQTRNLYSIKGKINFTENLRKNTFLKNRFVCGYSVLSSDNKLNQILRFTIERLLKITTVQRNRLRLKNLLMIFNDVKLININNASFRRLVFNRNNIRFKELIAYCKIFLNGKTLNLKDGKVRLDFMLFDMNSLFEKYIYKMFSKTIKDARIIYQYNKRYMLIEKTTSKNRIKLKPDLIIYTKNKNVVLDTKWKIVKTFASEKDIYQLNAYLDCIPNLDEAILLFPKTNNNDKIVSDYLIKGVHKTSLLKIRTIDLLYENESVFAKELSDLLK